MKNEKRIELGVSCRHKPKADQIRRAKHQDYAQGKDELPEWSGEAGYPYIRSRDSD
jgi:hypothetical protein